MKFYIIITYLILNFSLYCQNYFEFYANFKTPAPLDVLLDFQIIDFNSDTKENFATTFINDSTFSIFVFNKSGQEIYRESNLLGHNKLLKGHFLKSDEEVYYVGIFSSNMTCNGILKAVVYNLTSNILVDSLTIDNGTNLGYDFWEFYITDLKLITNEGGQLFSVGYNVYYDGHGPGVDYSGTDPFYSTFFFEEGKLIFNETLSGFNYLVFPGEIGFGKTSYRSSVPKQSFEGFNNELLKSTGSNFSFFNVRLDSNTKKLTTNTLFELNSNDDNYFNYNLISSNDYSNLSSGISFLKYNYREYIFINYDYAGKTIIWDSYHTNISINNIELASNLIIDGREYLIYFNGYKEFEVRDKISGDTEFFGKCPFKALRIDENVQGEKIFLSFWNETFTIYKLAENLVDLHSDLNLNLFELSQNYPNPFNPSTKIEYSVGSSGNVQIEIFNNLGEHVIELVNEYKKPGTYEVNFDAQDFKSGVYFYRLNTDFRSEVKKMVLVK